MLFRRFINCAETNEYPYGYPKFGPLPYIIHKNPFQGIKSLNTEGKTIVLLRSGRVLKLEKDS